MSTLTNATIIAAGFCTAVFAATWFRNRGAAEQWTLDEQIVDRAHRLAERQRLTIRQYEQLCLRQQARISELERSCHPSAKYPLNLRLREEQSN